MNYFATSGKGKSGWLSPNGHFYPCGNEKHCSKAAYLLKKIYVLSSFNSPKTLQEEFFWIPMGSSSSSYVHFNLSIDKKILCTEKQIEWLQKNYNLLDFEQQKYVDVIFRRYGKDYCKKN